MPDYIIINGELYHHGVKGMRWGVRRYRNKDGTLTPAGKKRYAGETDVRPQSPTKGESGHRLRLEKKYRESGMTPEEASAAAQKRIKVEKVIAATAGLTVAACLTYYAANRTIQNHCDTILKAGTTFHNLDSAANPRPGEHLYVNYRQSDTNYFRGYFAVNKMRKTGAVFDHTLTATEDIKIPSINTRKSVFKELFDKDPAFRAVVNQHIADGGSQKDFSARKAYKNMWRLFGDKDDPGFNQAKRKYFDALRQKGYEAIVDEWDTKPLVYRSDAPLILLNTSSKSFGDMTIKELGVKDILLAKANSKNWQTKRSLLNTVAPLHNNDFTESKRELARYTKKSSVNAKYIDKVLDEMGRSIGSGVKSDLTVNELLKSRDGSAVVKAGKLLEKNQGMSPTDALKKIRDRDDKVNTALFVGGTYGSLVALSEGKYIRQVENYLKKHPNTNLSNKELMNRARRGKL